jgi:hypothetical protein
MSEAGQVGLQTAARQSKVLFGEEKYQNWQPLVAAFILAEFVAKIAS